MGLFKKKQPKGRKSIVDSANDLKHEVEGELLPSKLGLEADEIERLLELLGRDNEKRIVFRRQVGSILDRAKRFVFWNKSRRLTVEEAKDLVHEIVEKQKEQEARLLKKRLRQDPDYQPPQRPEPESIKYPEKLSPDDVLESINTVIQRLEEPQTHEKETVEERRAKRVFEALEQLKIEEATRFARYVATKQGRHIKRQAEGETGSADNAEQGDIWAEYGFEDDELERIRTLQGFGKKPLKSLIDAAGDMVDNNVEVASKVVQQWIGNTKPDGK